MKRLYQVPSVHEKTALCFPVHAQSIIPCIEGDARQQDSPTSNCYMFFDEDVSWAQANAACNALGEGAHLVTIGSSSENNIVVNLAGGGDVWVGGTQPNNRSTPIAGWSWVTGEPFSFDNWAGGEPNDDDDVENNDENCLEVYSSGEWNDLGCTEDNQPYVCERG